MFPWPKPEVGEFVWCHFPHTQASDVPIKPRPALIIAVTGATAPIYVVRVAYGTSQRVNSLFSGEFAFTPNDRVAFEYAGLSYPTKFDLRRTVELPYTNQHFTTPPLARFPGTPKLGVLHPSAMLRVRAAWEAIQLIR
jgi:hypothetical protein